ncbi:MAG: hypothetical protein JOZ90_14455 [Alphaproteobacteria bacterium]|nr:hypothetical protein [Alphaproteobacteria bacterium]MBV9371888.1 hypothetical protein [Alphaproteobacteria bacterium]MBV9902274.1 hypothetical protein [Alphaproteobacteria bacterium]
MEQTDLDYYRSRIAAEQRAAARARHPLAADCHRRLAEEYADLIVASQGAGREAAHG